MTPFDDLFEVVGFDRVADQKGLSLTLDEKKQLSVRKAQRKRKAWLKRQEDASKVKKSLFKEEGTKQVCSANCNTKTKKPQ